MVDMASGMSLMGLIPFRSTFAVFAGRCFENIRNGICYPHANVKLAFSHAGISVGEDGGTHQSIEDIALMRVLPGMTVLCPCDDLETRKAVAASVEMEGPVYLRLARMATRSFEDRPFEIGKGRVMREGKDAVAFTCGAMVEACMDAAELLARQGIELAVINLHTIKPWIRTLYADMRQPAQSCSASRSIALLAAWAMPYAMLLNVRGHTG